MAVTPERAKCGRGTRYEYRRAAAGTLGLPAVRATKTFVPVTGNLCVNALYLVIDRGDKTLST